MASHTFYPNLPMFLRRYICQICDILQLCFQVMIAHPGSPPANVQGKAVCPDAHQDGHLLVDAEHAERSGASSDQVDSEAHAAKQLDLVVVKLQGLLVDVEAEEPPVLVSALHRLHHVHRVLREPDDPEKAGAEEQ